MKKIYIVNGFICYYLDFSFPLFSCALLFNQYITWMRNTLLFVQHIFIIIRNDNLP